MLDSSFSPFEAAEFSQAAGLRFYSIAMCDFNYRKGLVVARITIEFAA
jgi:hypothetical protein